MDIVNLLKRKITVTFAVIIMTAIPLAFQTLDSMKDEPLHGLGSDFLGWFTVFVMYAGAVILIYGNLVSAGIEYLQHKGYIAKTWVYIGLHGVFGSAIGLLFQVPHLALYGAGIAVFFAVMDRWICKRLNMDKKIGFFYLFPILVCGLFWGYFQIISEPLPPFTAEDAVEKVTEGNGTPADPFPSEIGKSEQTIEGYRVVKETAAEPIGNGTYRVTFTETWQKDGEEGSYEMAYEVDRNSLTARDLRWEETPAYYEN